jgi:predicted HAD superfamily phosphohydrolase YqeG
MTDNEFRESWNFSKMVAINIGSVTLSKEDVLAIDEFISRQKAEIERLQDYNENLRCINTDLSNNLLDEVETARAEAVKEFAERLKEHTHDIVLYGEIVTMSKINNLVKEFTEEAK